MKIGEVEEQIRSVYGFNPDEVISFLSPPGDREIYSTKLVPEPMFGPNGMVWGVVRQVQRPIGTVYEVWGFTVRRSLCERDGEVSSSKPRLITNIGCPPRWALVKED